MKTSILAFALAFFAVRLTAGADWPQYRGPSASGLDDSVALPTTWDVKTGANIRWQTPIPGLAHASPIIWGDRVYLATAVKPGESPLRIGLYGDIESVTENQPQQWRLLALDKATGKIVWDTLALEAIPRVKRHPKATHCNSTPATDGRHIVEIFGSEGLFCFDMDGKLLWKKDLGLLDAGYYNVPSAQWGFGSSPIIHEGKVIVLCDVQKDSFLAAFDLADGREVWRTARNDTPTWGTPTIVSADGRAQIVVNGWHHSGGYDLATGKELWKLDGGGDIPVPTPIFAKGLIYLTSAHGRVRPFRAIRADATGDITPPDGDTPNGSVAWTHARMGNYMQTPLAVGGWVFACHDIGVLSCFDPMTGDVRYTERIVKLGEGFTASAVSDGRHLYFASEPGNIYVVPVSDKFSVVATNSMEDVCMATPAISDGALFFRTREKIIAIGAKP